MSQQLEYLLSAGQCLSVLDILYKIKQMQPFYLHSAASLASKKDKQVVK